MEIAINGTVFTLERIYSKNRNASIRLKGNRLILNIPSRWSARDKEKIGDNLLKRALRALEKGKWKPDNDKRTEFSDGQRLRVMGQEFEVLLSPSKRFAARASGSRIEVKVNENHPKKKSRTARLVRERIVKTIMPQLRQRVDLFNQAHFQARIAKICVRDNTSRWGSCSTDGSIYLSFRLLMMPLKIIDYVIVHELAHTKYRGHGKRFWALVKRALPDYEERKRWLRENESVMPEEQKIAGQQTLLDF